LTSETSRLREAAAVRIPEQVEEIIRLAEIPAPPFREERRARYLLARLAEIGLDRPRLDAEGNALAELAGPREGPRILVAAHVDTVFPEGTDVTVARDNGLLRGPGIGDNAANLGALLSAARILVEGGGIERGEILFAGTVGEEGLGNLRGMRRLVEDLGDTLDHVVCLDGHLGKVIVRGVGSARFRIVCRGPGGHSFGEFGRPSAVHGIARLVSRIIEIDVPGDPKTTFNVGSLRGGEGITSIASVAEMLLDLRSEDPEELHRLLVEVRGLVEEEGRRDGLTFEVEELGVRPAGATDPDSALVRTVVAALEEMEVEPVLEASSTDANVPMSVGIPAVTFGTYRGRGAHTLEEEVAVAGMETGLAAAVLVLGRLTST
jgi:tripeptide aminopeptidase